MKEGTEEKKEARKDEVDAGFEVMKESQECKEAEVDVRKEEDMKTNGESKQEAKDKEEEDEENDDEGGSEEWKKLYRDKPE